MLSSEEVGHIAKLAKLRLDAAEEEAMATELSRVIEYIGVLDQVATVSSSSGAKTTPPASQEQVGTRDDVARSGMPVERLLQNAPESLDRFLLVPAIK